MPVLVNYMIKRFACSVLVMGALCPCRPDTISLHPIPPKGSIARACQCKREEAICENVTHAHLSHWESIESLCALFDIDVIGDPESVYRRSISKQQFLSAWPAKGILAQRLFHVLIYMSLQGRPHASTSTNETHRSQGQQHFCHRIGKQRSHHLDPLPLISIKDIFQVVKVLVGSTIQPKIDLLFELLAASCDESMRKSIQLSEIHQILSACRNQILSTYSSNYSQNPVSYSDEYERNGTQALDLVSSLITRAIHYSTAAQSDDCQSVKSLSIDSDDHIDDFCNVSDESVSKEVGGHMNANTAARKLFIGSKPQSSAAVKEFKSLLQTQSNSRESCFNTLSSSETVLTPSLFCTSARNNPSQRASNQDRSEDLSRLMILPGVACADHHESLFSLNHRINPTNNSTNFFPNETSSVGHLLKDLYLTRYAFGAWLREHSWLVVSLIECICTNTPTTLSPQPQGSNRNLDNTNFKQIVDNQEIRQLLQTTKQRGSSVWARPSPSSSKTLSQNSEDFVEKTSNNLQFWAVNSRERQLSQQNQHHHSHQGSKLDIKSKTEMEDDQREEIISKSYERKMTFTRTKPNVDKQNRTTLHSGFMLASSSTRKDLTTEKMEKFTITDEKQLEHQNSCRIEVTKSKKSSINIRRIPAWTWKCLNSISGFGDSPPPITSSACCSVQDRSIFVFGGQHGSVYTLDPCKERK